jgi:hypothetical protein
MGENAYYDNLVSLGTGSEAIRILEYPSPATDYIHIRVVAAGNVSLYDGMGRRVKKQSITSGINQMDIKSLSPGIYYGMVGGQQFNFVK